jgi:DNA-directed RNA polymerase subunit RPC12/RpoP
MIIEAEIECTFTDEVVCPYCGYEFSDSWEFLGGSPTYLTPTCGNEKCEKEFEVLCEYSVNFTSSKKNDDNKIYTCTLCDTNLNEFQVKHNIKCHGIEDLESWICWQCDLESDPS